MKSKHSLEIIAKENDQIFVRLMFNGVIVDSFASHNGVHMPKRQAHWIKDAVELLSQPKIGPQKFFFPTQFYPGVDVGFNDPVSLDAYAYTGINDSLTKIVEKAEERAKVNRDAFFCND